MAENRVGLLQVAAFFVSQNFSTEKISVYDFEIENSDDFSTMSSKDAIVVLHCNKAGVGKLKISIKLTQFMNAFLDMNESYSDTLVLGS